MPKTSHTRCLIIGSGPAGLTAGIYTARAGLNPILITGGQTGGQLLQTDTVDNYPGVSNISGFALIEKMKEQYVSTGATLIEDKVIKLNLNTYPFIYHLNTDDNNIIRSCSAVILAMGTKNKWLNCENEEKYRGRGISICAICDGFFYKNKTVAVIGGGNSALYEALYLSNIAQKVYLINKNKDFKSELLLKNNVLNNKKIHILNQTNVKKFIGDSKLQQIELYNIRTRKTFILDVNGVFEAIGSDPNTDLVKGQVKITKKGYILTNKHSFQTSKKGVFACGDIQEGNHRQAIIASASGCIAALSVEAFLNQ